MNNLFKKLESKLSFLGRRELGILIMLIIEIVFFSIVTEFFLSIGNFRSILMTSVDLAIVSIGMTLVILMGGIDVSVGSVLGVVAIFISELLMAGFNPFIVVILALILGALLGGINGLLVGYGKVPPIIATLGTMNLWRAVIFGLLGGKWISGVPPVFSFLNKSFIGIPISLILIFALYFLFWVVTNKRKFGRKIYAIGNNQECARLAGIKVKRTLVYSYMTVGALTAIAAIAYIGRMGGVEITIGNDLPLQAIAAVIIGGTAATGGKGSVIGTLLGVFFINVMQNGILLLGIPSLWERAVIGILIIVSIGIDMMSNKKEKQSLEGELNAA